MDTKAIVITHRSSFEFFDLYSNHQEVHGSWHPTKARETLEGFGLDKTTSQRLRSLDLPRPVEILLPSARGKHHADGLVFRGRTSPLLLEDLVQIDEGIYVVVPELALTMIAGHVSRPHIAAIADQVLGTYRTLRKSAVLTYERSNPFNHLHTITADGGGTRLAATMYGLMPQTTLRQLSEYVHLRAGDFGIKRLREALPLCSENLCSPLETQDYLLLCSPYSLGGFNLAKPVVNMQVVLSSKARKIISAEALKPDFLWPKEHVVVEVLGKADHEGSGVRIADTSKRERVWRSMGYTAITHTSAEIHNSKQLTTCARELARLLGQRYRADTKDFSIRQAWLRQEVLGNLSDDDQSIRSYKELLADAELAWNAARY